MKFTLRPYQAEADNAIKSALIRKKNVLLTGPCACGKTVIFSSITDWLHGYGRTVLILLDRENLVVQTAKRVSDYIGEWVGIACSSVSSHRDLSRPVVVASRQTLAPMMKNGAKGFRRSLTILDECHLVGRSGQYRDILDQLYENYPDMRLFGTTATPYRLSGGRIYGKPDSLFDQIDFKITTTELLEQGFVVPLEWKIRKSDLNAQLDLVRRSSTGDLNEAEQFKVLGRDTYVKGVFDVWREQCQGRKTAIYALNIEHAQLIQSVFESEGVSTWIIHSKLSTKQVNRCVKEFTASGNGVIINIGILTIGSDIPSISAVILARRTLSTALFFQIVGRGSRLSPGKADCLVIDLCGNALIHGNDPDDPIRNEREEKKWEGEPRIKVCPMCETGTHLAARVCKHCGFEFPYEEKEPEEIKDTGDKPELIDFKGFTRVECDHVRYFIHPPKYGKPPTIRAEYRRLGAVVGKQWLCPQHTKGSFPQQKAGRYWRELGGKWPVPASVVEWIQRCAKELEHRLELTVNYAGQYPEVKKVKPIGNRLSQDESRKRVAASGRG